MLRGNTLCTDGPEHYRLRRIIAKPLSGDSLKALDAEITVRAEQLVEKLLAGKAFDAVSDLATPLPVDIVGNAVGLPEQGREHMLVWAQQMFNCFGPMNDRTRRAFR